LTFLRSKTNQPIMDQDDTATDPVYSLANLLVIGSKANKLSFPENFNRHFDTHTNFQRMHISSFFGTYFGLMTHLLYQNPFCENLGVANVFVRYLGRSGKDSQPNPTFEVQVVSPKTSESDISSSGSGKFES